ncbi:MAG: hypothetical protein ABIH90_00810 [Candidatus Aenigmatarchaeota archaeon]
MKRLFLAAVLVLVVILVPTTVSMGSTTAEVLNNLEAGVLLEEDTNFFGGHIFGDIGYVQDILGPHFSLLSVCYTDGDMARFVEVGWTFVGFGRILPKPYAWLGDLSDSVFMYRVFGLGGYVHQEFYNGWETSRFYFPLPYVRWGMLIPLGENAFLDVGVGLPQLIKIALFF